MAAAMHAPEHAGSRDQARELLGDLPEDLTNGVVVVDCTNLKIGTPSFFDELIKVVVVERGALAINFENASERVQHVVERCARNRLVEDRVHVELRHPGRSRSFKLRRR